jgi:hypothetical protein
VDAESLVFEVMNYLERLANQQGIRLQAVDAGAGLGPSICREIAMVHGLDLQARRGEPSMIFDLSITRLGTSQAIMTYAIPTTPPASIPPPRRRDRWR